MPYVNAPLSRLLSQRQWTPLYILLTSAPRSTIVIDDQSAPYAVTSNTIIHFALRFQAPFYVISRLSRMYPRSLASCDAIGRYPIHVACEWAATLDIVDYLIKTNPSAVAIPDANGKTPVHYVGEFYLENFNQEEALYNEDDAMLQVVCLLKRAAPQSVNLEDNAGMNAIEHAINSDANMEVIRTMQQACRDDWRERSKGSDGIDGNESATSGQQSQAGRRKHQNLLRELQVGRLAGVTQATLEATIRAARMAWRHPKRISQQQ